METTAAINSEYFYNSKRHSDIIVRYGDTIFDQLNCHKIILCSNSPYFDRMLDPANGYKVTRGAHRIEVSSLTRYRRANNQKSIFTAIMPPHAKLG